MNPRLLLWAVLLPGLAGPGLRAADTLALWPCRPSTGPDRVLADAGPHGLHLQAHPQAVGVTGRYGAALRPGGPARATRGWPRPDCWSGPWTLECWLRLDADLASEAVILELPDGPVILRFSLLPGEPAFVWSAPAADPGPGVAARRVEIARDDGPPGAVVWMRDATLGLPAGALSRERWCHVALVHEPAHGLRLFLDGRVSAVAAWTAAALPPGTAAGVSVGASADGTRVLAGALQDLRLSGRIVYTEEFSPPTRPLTP